MVTEDWVVLSMRGALGAWGKVAGSGLRWYPPAAPPTLSDADHDVSPLSLLAVHVYRPESPACRSVRRQHQFQYSQHSVQKVFVTNLTIAITGNCEVQPHIQHIHIHKSQNWLVSLEICQ